MKRATAEKLLGGYATGTLTAEERRTLFEAALAHQDLFDALADEEALRELLADPAARTQVLAALAAPAPNPASAKVVPLWRRPGVLGAAAGVLMASLAGLTWLRNPQAPPPAQQAPPPARQAPASPKALSFEALPEAPAEPAAESKLERRAAAQTLPNPKKAPAQEAPPPPAASISADAASASAPTPPPPPPTPVPAAVPVPAHIPRPVPVVQDNTQDNAQDKAGKAAGAPLDRPAPQALMEVRSTASQARAKTAKAEGRLTGAPVPEPPTWTLTPQPDGTTLVTVTAPPQTQVWLLKRGGGGVEVLQDRAVAFKEVREAQRRYLVRLDAGNALDLYVLAHPVADPEKLPETGPVAGFRTRIFPAKKDPAP